MTEILIIIRRQSWFNQKRTKMGSFKFALDPDKNYKFLQAIMINRESLFFLNNLTSIHKESTQKKTMEQNSWMKVLLELRINSALKFKTFHPKIYTQMENTKKSLLWRIWVKFCIIEEWSDM